MHYRFYGSGVKTERGLNIAGLLADIEDIMKNMEENGERATPETVLALAVWREEGKRDGKDHEQKQSSEIA